MRVTPRSVVSMAPRAVFRLGTPSMLSGVPRRCGALHRTLHAGTTGRLWRYRDQRRCRMPTAAELMVKYLENEGVSVVFGVPGEENIRFIQALAASTIRYVLTRHEQGGAFMAE